MPVTTFRWMRMLAVLMILALPASGCAARSMVSEAPAADFAGESAPSAGSPMEAPATESAAPQMAQAGAPAADGQTSALLNRKMIARASLELIVADANETVRRIEEVLTAQDGFVANANLYNDSYIYDAAGERTTQVRGNMTLRVPADNLQATMAALEALAVRVGTRTLNREDVTDQYSDVDAQLRNLRATEDELREMLGEVRAKPNAKPEDILAVHNRLMEIRGQIEQAQGRKNMLDNLIGLSTIDVTLTPDVAQLPVVEEGWQPTLVVREAARALVSALQGFASFAIWLGVYVLPILLIVLIPLALLLWIMRGLLRRRRANAAGVAQLP